MAAGQIALRPRLRFLAPTFDALDSLGHVTCGLLIALTITTFFMQGFRVSGVCMRPHLYTGERILANKMAYRLTSPNRGDIVVFHYPVDPTQTYVKRVIGMPGDTIAIAGGQVVINGHALREPYLRYVAHGDMASQYVPPGTYFMMGDNRDSSDDSRYWGELPRNEIIGKACAVYWPITQAQILR